MKHIPLPPLEELKEFLDYNPHTGIFTWKKRRPRITVGQEAGAANGAGYRCIQLNRKKYLSHRLAYYMYHAVDPSEKQVDHINCNKEDDRIKNLRLATNQENQRNMSSLRRNNTSGKTGVSWCKRSQRWRSSIAVDRKKICLGFFIDKEDAIQARIEAEKKYFGEFRHGL